MLGKLGFSVELGRDASEYLQDEIKGLSGPHKLQKKKRKKIEKILICKQVVLSCLWKLELDVSFSDLKTQG